MTDSDKYNESIRRADHVHRNALERQREAREDRNWREERKERQKERTQQMAVSGNINALHISHELDAETREREFHDLVRNENLRLQAYQKELAMLRQDREAATETEINKLTRVAMIDIAKMLVMKKLGLSNSDITDEAVEDAFNDLKNTGKI